MSTSPWNDFEHPKLCRLSCTLRTSTPPLTLPILAVFGIWKVPCTEIRKFFTDVHMRKPIHVFCFKNGWNRCGISGRRYVALKTEKTRMWANAQRDGRPAEYRWRPLFNAAKFGWRPLLECRAVTKPKRETRWNLQVCPKLTKQSQPLVGRSSPYYGDMWRRYCCLTSFFRLAIHALFAKI